MLIILINRTKKRVNLLIIYEDFMRKDSLQGIHKKTGENLILRFPERTLGVIKNQSQQTTSSSALRLRAAGCSSAIPKLTAAIISVDSPSQLLNSS
jgi:hypothetical protein